MNIVNWVSLSIVKYAVLTSVAWAVALVVFDVTSVGSYTIAEVWDGLSTFASGMFLLQWLPSVVWIVVAHLVALKRDQVSVRAALSWGIFLPPLILIPVGGVLLFLLQAAIHGVFVAWVKDFDPAKRY